jgi:hypothetical protein
MPGLISKAAVGALAACGVLGLAAAPASAASEVYDVTVDSAQHNSYARGSITWYNRTANIQGKVVDLNEGAGATQVIFEAFAGSTKIDSETRTADDSTDLGTVRDYNFTIGDTELVGGIDRIKITVCHVIGTYTYDCSSPENYSKA